MTNTITIRIDGERVAVGAGISLVAALAQCRAMPWRRSVSGQPRAPFCGIGVCYECRVRVDGHVQRACQLLVRDGMEIETDV
jgi:sarcosine oxidase subunit alpha